MSAEIIIPLADHGELVATLPFVAPAFLVVSVVAWMRFRERGREDS